MQILSVKRVIPTVLEVNGTEDQSCWPQTKHGIRGWTCGFVQGLARG